MKCLSKFILVCLFDSVVLFGQTPDTAWTKTYGGTNTDYGRSVQQTTDEGYIIAGGTWSYSTGKADVYLIKTNASGDTMWTRTYGGADGDWSNSVQQTSDGGYIVAGQTDSYDEDGDVYLIKTNGSGDALWTRTYGGADCDWGRSVQQTTDGGYIVAGYTLSYGTNSMDVYLIKTNGSGDALWTRTYGGAEWDWGYSVQQTTDGGYIVAGETESYDEDGDVYLIKTNASGDTLWTRAYGGTDLDEGYSVQQTTDGGYIVAGETGFYGEEDGDVYLIKTNSLGDKTWTKTYGGTDDDWGNSVQQTTDGGYIIAGVTASSGSGGSNDVYLIKLKPEGGGIEEEIFTSSFSLFPADPNPFTTETMVSYKLPIEADVNISVYNMLGQRVRDLYSGKQSSGVHSVSWNGVDDNGKKLSSGIHFLKVEYGGKEASTKIMFVR